MIKDPDNIVMRKIDILNLGIKPYKEVWDLQKELVEKRRNGQINDTLILVCLLYTSPSPRDATLSRMPSSA